MIDTRMEWTFDCWNKSDGIPQRKHVIAYRKKESIEIFKKDYPNYGFDEPYIDY
ncbi:hypothetical protein PL373_06060 [Tenacibaculum maritimum]|nr:hypothetical protein [Tenacibaculum maritimum]MDB0600715.1 hypothetical protein [Tenacibaculum maritimum]MDB0612698.1 hypothetical protein [Tenacibaculum maritimum]